MGERKIVIATRASDLAIAQARSVVRLFKQARPGIAVSIQALESYGDKTQEKGTPLYQMESIGVFAKDVQVQLLERRADVAVHSYKDLPTESPEGLDVVAAVLREDPRDVLISRRGLPLRDLPPGVKVGTSSLRRQAMLRAARSDIQVVSIRGNVPTRIGKVKSGEVEACVLAYAGVRRLKLTDEITEVLDTDVMLPAPAQGALALEVREKDTAARELCAAVHDPTLGECIACERHLLKRLGGGCSVPVGALAQQIEGERIQLDAAIADPSGKPIYRVRSSAPRAQHIELASAVADRLYDRGAQLILDAVRNRPI